MTEQQKNFLALVTQPALESERRWDIPAPVTIAQAIIESSTPKGGWGTSPLFTEFNNPFGIKVHQHLRSEPYAEFETTEYHGEHPELERARFMQYSTLAAAFHDHGALFYDDRYGAVVDLCKQIQPPYTLESLRPICEAIQQCGYSTDPRYAEKLLQLIAQIQSAEIQPAMQGGAHV